jgi:hypothetical protein
MRQGFTRPFRQKIRHLYRCWDKPTQIENDNTAKLLGELNSLQQEVDTKIKNLREKYVNNKDGLIVMGQNGSHSINFAIGYDHIIK